MTKHQLLRYLVDTGQITYRRYLCEDIKADFEGWPWYKILAWIIGCIIAAFLFWAVGVIVFI